MAGEAGPQFKDVPEIETEELKVALINQDEELESRARFEGENNLAHKIDKGRGIGRLVMRFWQNGIAKNYYRQREINESRKRIRESQKLYSEASDSEYREYKRNVCKTFLMEAEGAIDPDRGDRRESLKATNPGLHAAVKDLVERYADGRITDREDLNREFSRIMDGLAGGEYSKGKHLSVNNIDEIAIKARHNFENLATAAESVNSEFNHAESMSKVMKGFDVLYGKRNTDTIDPHYNKVDKVVDKLSRTRVGSLVSHETLALATGAAACVATVASKRALRTACLIPGLGSAIYATAEAGVQFEDNRARAQRDERYSREYDGSQKERQRMKETLYSFQKSEDLKNSLNTRISAIRDKMGRGEAVTDTEVNSLFNFVARTQWCLRQEGSKNPVIAYTSEIKAPKEQLELLNAMVEAKKLLGEQGINDLSSRLDKSSDIMRNVDDSLRESVEEATKRAKRAKVLTCAGKFGAGLATGLAIGVIAQEVSAAFNPNVQGIFENSANNNPGAKLTACCRLAKRFGLKGDTSPVSAYMDVNADKVIDSSKDIDFVKAKDGSYTMMQNGKEIAKGLDWDEDTGRLTQASYNKLASQGIKIGNGKGVRFQVPGTKTEIAKTSVNVSDIKKEVGTNGVVRAHRSFWWDNDTSGIYENNELAGYNYTDPQTGLHGFVTGMTNAGSIHNGKMSEFSQLARDGKVKLFISLSKDTQSTPIEVTGKLLGNGQVAFVPEPGSAAAACFDASGNFIGKYAEIAQVIGQNGSDITYAPFATAVGRGLDGVVPMFKERIVDTVTDLDVPSYEFTFPDGGTILPLFFPFTRRNAMNESRMRHAIEEADFGRARRGGYGYDYIDSLGYQYTDGYSEDGRRKVSREEWEREFGVYCSPRVKEGKELQLGQEMDYFAEKLREVRGDDYVAKVQQSIESAEKLKNLRSETKAVITIPVYSLGEYGNIYHTLETYAKQENVNFNEFTIALCVNQKQTLDQLTPEQSAARDRTLAEIERAKRDFPQLNIADFQLNGHGGLADFSEYLSDVTMSSIQKATSEGRVSRDSDILIIRNDADVRHMSKNLVSSYLKSMEQNPKTPIFNGTIFYGIDKGAEAPGFASVSMIERMEDMIGVIEGTKVHTVGINFAYRAKHFAAIQGSNFKPNEVWRNSGIAGYDDLKPGYDLEDAFRYAFDRRWNRSGNPDDHDIMDPDTRMIVRVGGASIDSDVVRLLTPYADTDHGGQSVMSDAYGQGEFKPRPDPSIAANFSETIPDPDDPDFETKFKPIADQFEREISSRLNHIHYSGSRLDRAMRWFFGLDDMGGMYTIVHDPNYRLPHTPDREFNGHFFELTDNGKKALARAIRQRWGDGSGGVHNTLQRAIADNEWI